MSDRYLLPSNATMQEAAMAGAIARISDVPIPNRGLYNPALCPAALLPWLAWAFSLDTWSTDWTEAQKRQAIADSVFVHRHKGTVGALEVAIGALGYEIELVEWQQLEPQGDPYTFGLDLEIFDVGIPDAAGFEQIEDVVNNAKNVRSHMNFIHIHSRRDGVIYCAGTAICGETITIAALVTP